MRIMNVVSKMFQGNKGRQILQGRKGGKTATWVLILISGIGTLMAFLINRKGNGISKSAAVPETTIKDRPRTRPNNGMNYAWAVEMAEDFLKKTDKKTIP